MRSYLKNLREKNNLSQQSVAYFLGISQQYYNMIERGERQKKMDIELMQKLAEVFGVSVEYIIEQENALKQSA